MQDFIVVGANPRSSSLGVRDRAIPEPAAVEPLLHELRAVGLAQAMILTTCDRVEVYAVAPAEEDAAGRVIATLADFAAIAPSEIARHLYIHTGPAAVRHLFAVAASLDGTILGDPHVIAQLKTAYRTARDAGALGGPLEALVQSALAAAKQVRTCTEIGRAPVSLAAAAVELSQRVHGDLETVRALLIGLSEIGEFLAQAMRHAGLGDLSLAHPTPARAESAARLLDCHVAAYPFACAELARADVIIGCLGSRRYAITPELVKALLKERRYQPILFIDTAVPGDVDPAVGALDAAFLYTLDDLEKVARIGRASREKEAARAREIIEAEVQTFLRHRAERAAIPVLSALRRHFELSRDAALRDAKGDADRATWLLINRLLHAPSTTLRRAAAADADDAAKLEAITRALRTLFKLDAAPEESDE
ncbi:MAG: glutamyl-tRNA reductase [Rhodospirillales bacterium]|nr:glutamyl-tRNA reductase [Rhodospirillales bacterium]